jgi:pyrimidine operon attenuation protein/uracil phosphoribosyltransferase
MPEASRTLLTKAQMAESIATLAKSIQEAHVGAKEIALVGIFTRGVPLAKRLAAALLQSGSVKVHFGTIDITHYRDDLSTFQMVPKLEGSEIDFDLDGMEVILCDEVIYTGRSVRAALDELYNFGRPKRVQLAVLIDRCGRELPVQPDFSALKVTLQPGERVAVRFDEVDPTGDSCTIETQPTSR